MIRYYVTQKARIILLAVRSLMTNGGPDLAASLAYYTLLSLVPFISLVVLLATSFVDIEPIRTHLSMIIGIYFPVSHSFLDATITPLFEAHEVTGTISIVTIIWGANGLFRATNRAVNRVYGSTQRKAVGIAVVDFMFGVAIIGLFLFSIAVSGLFRVAVDISYELAIRSNILGELASQLIQFILAAVPPLVTFLIFLSVYRSVPNAVVSWRDATFGAIIGAALFEAAKYSLFWFGAQLGNQSMIYGPLSSVVILLIWSQFAAMIFLFGVSLTRESAGLRFCTDGCGRNQENSV